MAELKEDYRKEERINGIVYDMSPSADYRHGIVNSNIHAILKQHLKNSLCLSFMENLDYRYHIPCVPARGGQGCDRDRHQLDEGTDQNLSGSGDRRQDHWFWCWLQQRQ